MIQLIKMNKINEENYLKNIKFLKFFYFFPKKYIYIHNLYVYILYLKKII